MSDGHRSSRSTGRVFLTPVRNSWECKKLRYAIQKSTKIKLEYYYFYLFSYFSLSVLSCLESVPLKPRVAVVVFSIGIRECAICGALATYECKNCFREFGDGLDKISFCDVCLTKVSFCHC